ncbi:MAG: enoyl-CoA hydratase [Bacteroidetes bacterium]|nr:MAG: enoyl-CoA hydratase [Bacteroidota bacterium]
MDFIKIEKAGNVLKIGLNRPKKMNAFNWQMLNELSEAYTLLENDLDMWCGLLYSTSDNFTTGLDLADVTPHILAGENLFSNDKVDPLRISGLALSKPLVMAVEGYCLTIGMELIFAADICVAAPSTRFGQIEVQRGILPFGGATIRMPERTGWANAMRYLLTGDQFDGTEAARIGMVSELAEDPVSQGMAIATSVSEQAPLAVQYTLKNARQGLTNERTAKEALTPAAIELMKTEDAHEGLQSFIERRKANFKGK